MQLVLSGTRIIAHGENFLAMGGVVINTETGAKYENATVAECDGCPSDIDKVGYEYHAGVFVPCAPYGTGNNNGYFMEVCKDCATPRSSGIPIKSGIKLENLHPEITALSLGGASMTLLWQNGSLQSTFSGQTVTLASADYDFLVIVSTQAMTMCGKNGWIRELYRANNGNTYDSIRPVTANGASVTFGGGGAVAMYMSTGLGGTNIADNSLAIPQAIYGMKYGVKL